MIMHPGSPASTPGAPIACIPREAYKPVKAKTAGRCPYCGNPINVGADIRVWGPRRITTHVHRRCRQALDKKRKNGEQV
jgi:hypothetical protein